LVLTTGYKQKTPANSNDREGKGYVMISLWNESITNLNFTGLKFKEHIEVLEKRLEPEVMVWQERGQKRNR
jgi:hypothetical protein